MYTLNASGQYKEVNKFLLDKLASKGYTIDRFGHATKVREGKKYRYKFQKTSVRYEIEVLISATQYSPASKNWVRLATHDYKDVKINV